MPRTSHRSHMTMLVIILIFFLTPPAQGKKKVTKPPEFLHSEFASLGIKEIYVLPAVDHRQNKEFDGKYQKPLRNAIEGKLEHKDYEVHLLDSEAHKVTEKEIAHPSPELIKSLAPPESEWIILPVLLKFERHTNIVSTGVASVRVYLFQTKTGDLIWQDSGEETVRTGVFLTFAAGHDAVLGAALKAMNSFPDNESEV